MFTGIIEEIGLVEKISGDKIRKLYLKAKTVLEGTKTGDSISVNGVCLTVEGIGNNFAVFSLMRETLGKTALAGLKPGAAVNLERAMRADSRFGGHIVSGHIDAVGKVKKVKKSAQECWLEIEADDDLLCHLTPKGSVAIDGVSLTIVEVKSRTFNVSLIPETLKQTTLGLKKTGDLVNLEADVIAKYVFRFMQMQKLGKFKKPSAISKNYLLSLGFDV